MFIIYVEDIMGKKYEIVCIGDQNSVEFIKFVICTTHLTINPSNIVLYHNGIEMEDWRELSTYGITDGSVLKMFFKMKSGFNLRR
jgi:hypothetical protein